MSKKSRQLVICNMLFIICNMLFIIKSAMAMLHRLPSYCNKKSCVFLLNSHGMISHCALSVSAEQVRLGEDCGWVALINHGDIITNTLPLLQPRRLTLVVPLPDTTAGAAHVQNIGCQIMKN